MRVVLDTNILVRASYRVGGPARSVAKELEAPQHTLVTSTYILGELRRVLNYPRLFKRHGMSPEQIQEYVEDVRKRADVVPPATALVAVPHDPDDIPVLQTAVAGRADVLCTLDQHFYHPDVQAYCASHGIRVMTDVELLVLLRAEAKAPPTTPSNGVTE